MTSKETARLRKERAGTAEFSVRRPFGRGAKSGEFGGRALEHFVVSRTAKKVSLAPNKAAVKAGRLSREFTIEIGGTKRSSDPKRELLDAMVFSVADRVAGVSEARARRVLARLRSERSETVFVDILIPGHRDQERAGETEIPAANKAALERAFKRAERSKAEILKQPDMLTGEQLAHRMGLDSRSTIDNRRVQNKLLALDFGAKRGFRYPEWQSELVQDGDRKAAFESTLQALGEGKLWDKYRFFVQPSPALGGKTPIEGLKAGEFDAVVRWATTWVKGEQGGG